MKIERFNESLENKKTYYRLYVYVVGDTPTMMNTLNTAKDALDELKDILDMGLPGTDGHTYHIHDAYIEKITRVKTDEIKAILKAKKFNL